MSTGAICGLYGTVGGFTEITRWEIELTQEAIDATSMDSGGWLEFIACLKGGNGTFTSLSGGGAVGLKTGATFKTKSTGGVTFTGNIIISSKRVTVDVADKVTWDYAFVFTGAITIS